MDETPRVGQLHVDHLIYVPQERLEEFVGAVSATGVDFHPVESQVHVDYDFDLNAPASWPRGSPVCSPRITRTWWRTS